MIKVISMEDMQRKTVNEKPLEMLDNIESCRIKLSRREQKVVDNIFQNIEEFESLQIRMKNALIEEKVNRIQLLDFFDYIVNDTVSEVNLEKMLQPQNNLLHSIFQRFRQSIEQYPI
jgi:hypothetical protein